ncbi:DUF1592 domain-containing protein [Phenylobacterium kunshanense]|uniref:DUF1592 domain-containing protein n=1 Tax=Phenylobacterium kunshanense TaxID=1445034 RepID=A0A328BHZ7_9CAUL|nr:DUF1592 domain-containing protein [Phenylobacterium kunshanense]RAK66239.1 hypothetical protein DJ019_08230 [Phenylobacterium kunshanense]
MRRFATIAGSAALATAIVLSAGIAVQAAWADPPQSTAGAEQIVAIRRLTESQYRHAIADAFGADVRIEGRFEPERREAGLLAIGSAQLSITPAGFEQYFRLADLIAGQVTAPERRARLAACQPAAETARDDACARQIVSRVGEALFRRPLTEAESAARVQTAAAGAEHTGDFYAGVALALKSLLVAPEFLFRMERAEPDPAAPGQYRLTGSTKAERLSFLFWDAPPDAELRRAAASGELHTAQGLRRQLARLAASPRLQQGGRAFFTDMLQLEHFDGLTKDSKAYPKFNQALADSAREQTLRTTVDMLFVQKRDYRELFTSNSTFINRHLAALYRVPFNSKGDWAAFTFPKDAERSGIITEATFLSLFAHPAASSPTRRGVKLHEIFMCEPTPDPPADVDFSKVQALETGTVRTRLLAHMENEGCAACHRVSDPVGLALEHFDGVGQRRTLENGQRIDVEAEINGVKFSAAPGLGLYLRQQQKIPACLVRNVYGYGVGRAPDERDEDYLADQTEAFASDGYRVPHMMVRIASSPEFFKVKLPARAKPATKVAAAATHEGGLQ